MPVIKVPTSYNIDVEFEIPEFYKRFVALLIDWVLLYIYMRLAIRILLASFSAGDLFDEDAMHNLWGIYMLLTVPLLIYFPVMELTMNGQSLGKRIMKLRIVHENGGRPNISQFMIRWLLRETWFIMFMWMGVMYMASQQSSMAIFMLSIGFIYFLTELVLVVSSRKGQRLGDILAHTITVSTNPKSRIEDTVFQEVAENYVPVFPKIMQLSDRDINAIKSILETARKRNDFNMAYEAAEKIKNHLDIQTSISPFDFLDTLLKDYNKLSIK